MEIRNINGDLMKKIRVYKRNYDLAPGTFWDPEGFLATRPWTCSGTPEDSRSSCYETWEDAMAWATMSSERRIAQLEYDAKFEMGQ